MPYMKKRMALPGLDICPIRVAPSALGGASPETEATR